MIIKTTKELHALREGGRILGQILYDVAQSVKPGMTTVSLDELAERLIIERGGMPSFKGYHIANTSSAYPATLCVSINEEVVHGIPSDRVFKEGDVVGLDIGMKYKGYYTDTALTVIVGASLGKTLGVKFPKTPSVEERRVAEQLVCATKEALEVGISEVRVGVPTGTIGNAISQFLRSRGYGVVYELVGHGVGSAVHEDPEIPNWGEVGKGYRLHEGEVIALEPMATLGGPKVKLLKDGWTWVTRDKSIAAHFEHTVVVTKNGAEVLTRA
ncbi:MAG TPA: type I methionyl aminopeptidase [Candidatus Paceibacterota bacterium]